MPPRPFEPDPDQQRVLSHERGSLLVRGRAGTGKSTILRERFARLVEGGADPERIALVVRSKRDRVDARRSLLDRLPMPLPSLRVFTAHALAFHVMGMRHAALGYPEPPRVLSAPDHFAKVRELLLGEEPSEWPTLGALLPLRGFADQVRQLVLRAQEALVSPEQVLERAERNGSRPWTEIGAFYRRYLDVLGAEGTVDFAGLVAQAAAAVELGEPPFDHVLVDDQQDATLSFERLLGGLRAPDVVAAGDHASHVFSFQGTTDLPLGRFEQGFDAQVVTLETRHRGPAPQVEGWRTAHATEELAAIARELRRIHVGEGVAWRRLAVVTRRQDGLAAALVRALDDARIPHLELEGRPAPGETPATAPYLLALRWLVASDTERDELVEAVLTSQLAGVSPATARAQLRAVRAAGRPPRDALDVDDGLSPAERDIVTTLRDALTTARARSASVLDAFRVLWAVLPCSARLVAVAETDPTARADLDAVVALAHAAEEAGASADPSIEAFLAALGAREGAPELATSVDEEVDAVRVLTAHGSAGLEFDTVFVAGAVEGSFPSLSRPEPMFEIADLEGRRTRSEVNRARLAEERRLFGLVLDRAARRVVLTASTVEGEDAATSVSRFAQERGVGWVKAPSGPFAEPASVAEAHATWRRTLADRTALPPERLASLGGLLALGVRPERWWFQLDWSTQGPPARETLHVSFSRLDHLENCALQYALADELGLERGGGHQAWVGQLVHSIIEDCEAGVIDRTPEAFAAEIERRWQEERFPSHAISEAEREHALEVLVPNWFERYGDLPAAATERRFTFEFEGASVNGVIDRIGPVPEGGTRITDFKTGRADNATRAAENLQLGIYYLAVGECEDLAEHRPLSGVELAFLGGKRDTHDLVILDWPVSQDAEESYKQRMRERLRGLVERIRELDETGRYVASTTANCFFCGFRTLCPRYPEGGPVFATADLPAEEPA